MQFKNFSGTRGPMTRIIRASNNVYPSQRVITSDECIDMEKSCSDNCQIIDAQPPSSACRHHHFFETRWVYKYSCCPCLGDLISLPVWLIILISILTILAFTILAVIFGLLFGLNRPTNTITTNPPVTVTTASPTYTTSPPPSCFNNGIYNYYYQRCECPESTCGEFCENCIIYNSVYLSIYISYLDD